ncbi:MAG TPA: PaaI family thioesterase [Casimicrobiaceae bacterium]|nr:PaaI family thioesterase [Casimicrobiaceae bacterium]
MENPGVTIDAFAERVRDSFARQGAMALIGARLESLRPGYCALTLVPRPETSQQHGYVHAGILATLVDSAGGYAGYTLFPADSSVLTVEFKLNLLAPAQGDRIVAEGFVVKSGRTLTITRGDVHAERNGNRTLVAIMQQTLMVMHGRPDAGRDDPDAPGAAATPGASMGATDA